MIRRMLHPRQSKAARALLDWSQADLSERSGVKIGTVKDFESARHVLNSKAMGAIVQAFQEAGLVLIFDDASGGAGVRYRERQGD
jgi:transcriptional regulator with XRE-family HTH domain